MAALPTRKVITTTTTVTISEMKVDHDDVKDLLAEPAVLITLPNGDEDKEGNGNGQTSPNWNSNLMNRTDPTDIDTAVSTTIVNCASKDDHIDDNDNLTANLNSDLNGNSNVNQQSMHTMETKTNTKTNKTNGKANTTTNRNDDDKDDGDNMGIVSYNKGRNSSETDSKSDKSKDIDNDNYNNPVVKWDDLAYETRLQSMVKKRYPNIDKLWRYNCKGTLLLLQAKGAVTFQRGIIKVRIDHDNNDNIATWQEYKMMISRFWSKVNDSLWLKKARQEITNELHNEHFKVLPFWPAVGKENTRHLNFEKQGNYDLNDLTVYWTAYGYIRVKDVRQQKDKFYTECYSDNVTLKVIKLDHVITRKIEKLCLKGFEKAKDLADEQTDKNQSVDAILWKQLEQRKG